MIPVLIAELDQQVVPVDPCIRHEDIELAHELLAFGDEALDFFPVCKIARYYVNPLPEGTRELIEDLASSP